MTVHTALVQGTELLGRSIDNARLTAEVLLGHAIGRDRVYFYAHPEQELREVEWLHYGRYLHERLKGKPTQYITGRQEFYGRDFLVTPDVLIPRPETESLVETVLKLPGGAEGVIDVGTGSGAIAITLALESRARVFATDISAAALRIAALNAGRHSARIGFVLSDLLGAFPEGSMDLIVSNPPYVAEADRDSLQSEVREWEPALALFAGADGMSIYKRLIPEAFRILKRSGILAVELGAGQAAAVSALAAGWRNLRIFDDLAGIRRVLVCEKP